MFSTIKAVLWGFLGVRSQRGFDKDKKTLNPMSIVAVGFVFCILFVASLMILVNVIV